MRLILILVIATLAGVSAAALIWSLWSVMQNLLAPPPQAVDADAARERREREL